MIDLHIINLRAYILDFLCWRWSYPCLFIGELHTANQKFTDHVARNKPQLIAKHMNRLNLIHSQVSVRLVKNFAIGSTSHDFHAEAKEDKIVAYIDQSLL